MRPIIRHHHERYDGSGYPFGLRGEEIPLVAQIMGIVDVYDALTTARPYKPAWPVERAFGELQRETRAGRMRGDFVRALLDLGTPRLMEIAREAHMRRRPAASVSAASSRMDAADIARALRTRTCNDAGMPTFWFPDVGRDLL